MVTQTNYGMLDRFRWIAAFLVIAIHTSPLTCFGVEADFFFTRVVARIAVPFFFMVTGQFVVSKFYEQPHAYKTFHRFLKKTLIVYGICIVLYLPLGLYAGHYQQLSILAAFRMLIFDGTFYHLWYFPACLLGVSLLYLASRHIKLHTTLCIAICLYFIGLLGDSYFGLIQGFPSIASLYQAMFHLFSYTRNGLFFAPIFLILGAYLQHHPLRMRPSFVIGGFFLSFILMSTEAFFLHTVYWQRHDSMYLFLLPTMVFLYQILLSKSLCPSPRMRTTATLMYILHPGMIVIVRGMAKFFHLSSLLIDQSLIHYLAVCLLTFACSFPLAYLLSGKKHRSTFNNRAWIELDRQALLHNLEFLQSRIPKSCQLMPVVKANAYGHGAVLLCKELNDQGIRHFCVACLQEGIELRKQGVQGEILILGYTHPSLFSLLRKFHLSQAVVDISYAHELARFGKKIHVHIAIDTGMHRLGERSENIDNIKSFFEIDNLCIDGIFSHLSADEQLTPREKAFTVVQSLSFRQVLSSLEQSGLSVPKNHLLASYGVLNYPELAGDFTRVGIALYGILSTQQDTLSWQQYLQPVLSLRARVAIVKTLHTNESVGYGLDFVAKHPMKIATLSIGYADGLPRNLSNGKGYVLISGHKAQILGKICMDQTIVDVSDVPAVHPGDIATLIGRSESMYLSASEVAENAQTISNEILSRLSTRLERVWTHPK